MASSPDTPSSDYLAMHPYWRMANTLLNGTDAVRAAGEAYLPKFPNETEDDYDYRRSNAKFTNIFGDICDDLAAKPFAEPLTIKDGTASERIVAICEDIDGRGNNLHVFAGNAFYRGIAFAVDWVLVEFTRAAPRLDGRPLSLADEERQGLRPYWVSIPATSMLAVYTATIRGKEEFVHARMRETITRRDGFDEVSVTRIRVLNREPVQNEFGQVVDYQPATFQIWEQETKSGAWSMVDDGPISIGVIPLVAYVTGRRENGSWRMIPPMKRAADLQIEHFQQETALKSIKELTAFPMLAGCGVTPDVQGGQVVPVPVGPRAVLYAPPSGENGSHGEWKFIEPTSESLRFLADDVKNTEQQLRELGRQPLTAQTGNLTVVTTAFAAQKGNSAIQAWALNLKDALEQALMFTALWLGDPSKPAVSIYTDFAIEMADDKGPDFLLKMRETGDLSRETLWSEARRRNILSSEFKGDDEVARLEGELPGSADDADIQDALGDEQAA